MNEVEEKLAVAFKCNKCGGQGANVNSLAMSGTGISRLLEIQLYRYAFVSCQNCGYTEIYDLKTLEGTDNLGSLLEVLFND